MRIFSKMVLVSSLAFASTANAVAVSFDSVANGVWPTGVSSSNVALSGGSADPHYALIKLPVGCAASGLPCSEDGVVGNPFGPSAYVVLGPNGTYPLDGVAWVLGNDSNSQWIGPRANQTSPTVGGSTFPNVEIYASDTDFYVYRMVFNLTALGLNPGTANIQLAWLSDNDRNSPGTLTSEIRLCSIATLFDPSCPAGSTVASSGNAGEASGSLTTVNITSGFTSGLMALDFDVYNSTPGRELNPSGLRVDILSATANVVPEPTTLSLLGMGLLGVAVVRRNR